MGRLDRDLGLISAVNKRSDRKQRCRRSPLQGTNIALQSNEQPGGDSALALWRDGEWPR